jgi:hypothetical protein
MGKEIDQSRIDEFLAAQPCAANFHFPFRLSISRGKGGAIPYGRVRIDSYHHWDGGGGRTDLHDVLGILWATSMRASGAASVSLSGYEGWCGPPELESRLLFFDQPYGAAVRESEIDAVEARLKAHTAWAGHDIIDAIRLFPKPRRPVSWDEETPPAWIAGIEPIVGEQSGGIWITRRNPHWSYYVNQDNTVSIARFEAEFRRALRHALMFWRPDAAECMGRYAVVANGLSNSVPVSVAERAVELISRIEGRARAKWRGPAATPETEDILMVPLENHCIFIGKRALVSIAAPCGKREFNGLRQRWAKQTSNLAAIFKADVEWSWQSPVDPSRLEQLVEALLTQEPGLQWCKPTGPSFDRDQGRDLVVSWFTPPGLNQTLTEAQSETPAIPRRVIVQVKARKNSVGKSDVKDVRDMLERHSAEGILLVADPIWSNDLYNYFETLAAKGCWIGLWARSDLEDRLRKHPYVANRFSDLVKERSQA